MSNFFFMLNSFVSVLSARTRAQAELLATKKDAQSLDVELHFFQV